MFSITVFSIVYFIVVLCCITILAVAAIYRMFFYLHMMQLEGYKNSQFYRWMNKFGSKSYSFFYLSFFLVFLVFLYKIKFFPNALFDLVLISINITLVLKAFFILNRDRKKVSKKKFVWTKRAVRLAISSSIVFFLITVLCSIFFYKNLNKNNIHDTFFANLYLVSIHIALIGTFGMLLFLQPFFVIIGNIIVSPIEKYFYCFYMNQAYKKMKLFKNCKVIGITGSYGKTSTKMIVGTILSGKYKVITTPESYNTPMGVCKVINNSLNDSHEVFIVEMGARRKGDIKELTDLIMPSIGVLTSIGPVHLETFKSIEGVIKTKFELIEGLSKNGIAVLNADNRYIVENSDKFKSNCIFYGLENQKADIRATEITLFEHGSRFSLHCKNDTIECETKLLGKHVILNILAGAAIAYELGFSMEQISKGIKLLEPIPHRLALMTPSSGVIIIDDAFNSNPDSAAAACEVLKGFKSASRVIITPGFVEQGKNEDNAHYEFGKKIAESATHAILVGVKRTEKIKAGLIYSNFQLDKIFTVSTLDEATSVLQYFIKPGDVVLFENDLTDNYSD